MKTRHFFLLVYLAKKTNFNIAELSTNSIAKEFNMAQQTVSRNLRELEKEGMINRTASAKGIIISVTRKGRRLLNRKYTELQSIFKKGFSPFLEGSVISGLGEGKYYMSLAGYKKQFKKKIGFIPFEGTLNLKTNQDKLQRFVENSDIIIINGFRTKKRTFGEIYAYRATINEINSALIIPKRTIHSSDIAEIVAPVYLRGKLKLRNGSLVKVSGV